jgi:hypothetical protein
VLATIRSGLNGGALRPLDPLTNNVGNLIDVGNTMRHQSSTATTTCNSRRARYSITSSARASSVGGTVRPSAFAVLRLIASSYLVAFCTGKSAGFSPLRMRSA